VLQAVAVPVVGVDGTCFGVVAVHVVVFLAVVVDIIGFSSVHLLFVSVRT